MLTLLFNDNLKCTFPQNQSSLSQSYFTRLFQIKKSSVHIFKQSIQVLRPRRATSCQNRGWMGQRDKRLVSDKLKTISSLSPEQMCKVVHFLSDLTTNLCPPSVSGAVSRPQSVQKNRGWVHTGCWKCPTSEGAASAASDLHAGPVFATIHQRRAGKLKQAVVNVLSHKPSFTIYFSF